MPLIGGESKRKKKSAAKVLVLLLKGPGPTTRSQLPLYATEDTQTLHWSVKTDTRFSFNNQPFYMYIYTHIYIQLRNPLISVILAYYLLQVNQLSRSISLLAINLQRCVSRHLFGKGRPWLQLSICVSVCTLPNAMISQTLQIKRMKWQQYLRVFLIHLKPEVKKGTSKAALWKAGKISVNR